MKWVLAVLWGIGVAAGEEIGEITADRPGMLDPAGVVGKGVLQTELGTSVQWDKEGTVLLTMGTPTMRLGLGRGMELRLGGDGLSARRTDRVVMGHTDFSVGMKRRVWSEGRLRPLFSLIPAVSMPVGDRRFTSHTVAPGVKFSLEKGLWGDVVVLGNLSWTAWKDEDGRYAESAHTLSVEREVALGIGVFGEVYRRRAEHRVAVPQYIVDGGVVRRLNPHVVVDVSAGRVMERGMRAWFIGFGIAFRHFLEQ